MDITTNWGWPQWTLLVLMLFSLIINCTSHGKPREPYNGFAGLISFGLSMFILICGGFFK